MSTIETTIPIINDASFTILHQNIRSIRNKHEAFDVFMSSLHVDIDAILFTETWLCNTDMSPQFTNYNIARLDRAGRGGGLAIYLRQRYCFQMLDDLSVSNGDIECLAIETNSFVLAVVYRPPTGYKRHFLSHMENLMHCFNEIKKPYFIMGDVNINMMSEELYALDLKNLVASYGCRNAIIYPTRITHNSSTSLDVCITSLNSCDYTSGILCSDLSDHLPIYISTQNLQHKIKCPNIARYRYIDDKSLLKFTELIERADWSPVYVQCNPDSAYNTFLAIFLECYDIAFPIPQIRTRKGKNRKPWINSDLLKRIKQKNALFHRFLATRDIAILREFKRFRNKLNSDTRKAKLAYYEATFSRIKSEPAKIWKQVISLTGRTATSNTPKQVKVNNIILEGKELANAINQYFVNVAVCDEDSTQYEDETSSCMNSLVLHEVLPEEVYRYIKELKTNVASGYDDVRVAPVKAVASILSPVLAYLVNYSFLIGIFPTKLKVAKVTPIHKGGNTTELTNYRPISVLPVFSKIYEKCINTRLMKYLEKYNILSPHQYGFRKNKTTEEALIDVKSRIIENIENKMFTLGVFLDLRKAFDSVDHNILLLKLSRYGIRGIVSDLFKSYLSSRQQFVSIDSKKSDYLSVKKGVPQGSILGPVLFLLYINDITEVQYTPEIKMFADDTSIFFTGSTIQEVEASTNVYLSKLSGWLTKNKLKLNTQKTKFIMFRPINKHISDNIVILFDNQRLEQVSTQKFLGVWFHEHLTWTPHVNSLLVDLARSVGCLSKIAFLLPSWLCKSLYYSMFYSKLLYGMLVWGTTTKTNYDRILILQKRALRVIEKYKGHPKDLDTQPLFLKHGILSARKVYNLKLMQHIHKHKLQDSFPRTVSTTYGFRNSTRKTKKTRTNYGKQAIDYKIIQLLNLHESNIDFTLKTKQFKCHHKSFLLLTKDIVDP